MLLLCALSTRGFCQDYEQQVASNPDDYRALYNAGVAAFKENKLERAQECFDLLKSHDFLKNDQREQVFYNAGNIEVKLQKYEDALASFEKVLTFNPDNDLARKKIEHIKTLLENKKEEQEKKNKQDKQDQDDNKNDKQDQSEKDKSEKDKPETDESEKDQESKEQDEKKDSQKSQEQQKSEEKDAQEQQADQEKDLEKDLTEQEKQLLAYVQDHDEKMHEQMEKQQLKKAQGVRSVRNNW